LLAAIGDRVFVDLNRDGVQDSGEPGLAGVTVRLYTGTTLVRTTTTDSSGYYLFDKLTPGTYSIEFDKSTLPAGYSFTAANLGSSTAKDSDANVSTGRTVDTELSAGETDLSWDAGVVALTAEVGDYVWADFNGNGLQDTGEPPVPNVTVQLLDVSGSVIRTTTTDSAGHYLFSGLLPGRYSVRFIVPGGTRLTLSGDMESTNNSKPDAAGNTPQFELGAGGRNLKLDAGLIPLWSPSPAPAPTPTPTPAPLPDPVPSRPVYTGADPMGLVGWALVALATGTALVVRRRRRTRGAWIN
jgi:hypothetical protein